MTTIPTTRRITTPHVPACTAPHHRRVFQHPLVEDDATRVLTPAELAHQDQLIGAAKSVCRACPLARECLTSAVNNHDIAGVVGGTTPSERRRIRRRLGITIARENLSGIAGAVATGAALTPADVLELRRRYPQDSLKNLAERVGCSLSTVKRYLRAARNQPEPTPAPETPRKASADTIWETHRQLQWDHNPEPLRAA